MYIYKVSMVCLKGDDYERACPDSEDVWCDYEQITENNLTDLITEEQLKTLKDGVIDYIIFRSAY